MRVLNAAQMREADRRTIEEIGIPSLVLMENAGRQVVAAMEARVRRPGRSRSRRRSAAAATTAATGSSSRARCCSAASTCRSSSSAASPTSAATRASNLDILGRLGLTVVEIADEPGVGAALLRDRRLHAHRRRDLRHRPERAARPGCSRRSSPTSTRPAFRSSPIDLPSRPVGRHAEPIGDSIEAGLTVTLAAPKLPLVLPPAETRAGDIVIADIGIPGRRHRVARRPARRAADARRRCAS